jgi:hypothetical protein
MRRSKRARTVAVEPVAAAAAAAAADAASAAAEEAEDSDAAKALVSATKFTFADGLPFDPWKVSGSTVLPLVHYAPPASVGLCLTILTPVPAARSYSGRHKRTAPFVDRRSWCACAGMWMQSHDVHSTLPLFH